MLDETTNVSNTSQAVVVLRYVTDTFDVHEEFMVCTKYHQLMQKLLLLLPNLL